MSKKPCGSTPQTPQQLEIAYNELLEELAARKLVEEEVYRLNRILEKLADQQTAALLAAHEGLKEENRLRVLAQEQSSQLNRDLLRHKERHEQLHQEMQAFCYSISHDLRAPLRHVMGFSGALLEDYHEKLDGTAQRYLDCVAKAGQKLETYMDALLGLSRIGRQELTLATLDLSSMARECAAEIGEAAPERRVSFIIAENLSVRADASLMRAALTHLLQNAWKYTAKTAQATIAFGIKEEGGEVVFFVKDNGIGFDMNYAHRLFAPFQRMHREADFEGIGIGLATIQSIIRRHGGEVWAEGRTNAGATFYFTIPDP